MTGQVDALRQHTERRIDSFMWWPAFAHLALCVAVGVATGTVWLVALFAAFAFPVVYLLQQREFGSLVNGCCMAALFMGLSALLIEQTGGLIEAHFSIFIMLSLLILYSDWRVIVCGAGLIAIHHALFTWLQFHGWVQLYAHLVDHAQHSGWEMIICLLQHAGAVVAHAVALSILAYVLRQMFDDSLKVAAFAVAAGKGHLDHVFTADELNRPTLAAVAQMQSGFAESLLDSQTIAQRVAELGQSLHRAQQQLQDQGQHNTDQVERVSASAAALRDIARSSADEASRARSEAETAEQLARKGSSDVVELQAAMRQIEGATGQIEGMLEDIDQITFQTNLLALNASVEAARAGQEGRGFAVVAAEVRDLAQRTKQIAHQIREAIGENRRTVNTGVNIAATTTDAMQQIVSTFQEVARRLGEVDGASGDQARGIETLEASAGSISDALQSAAQQIDGSRAVADELNAMAQQLAATVGSFKLPGGTVPIPASAVDSQPRQLAGTQQQLNSVQVAHAFARTG
ncbi:MAG: methyl-accepting chemotaxis protein [Gammaproteobacteria bacterium]|nr:MAG: methyl-accepting chemotaxis protein [Gammaproteobacteria bacterium]